MANTDYEARCFNDGRDAQERGKSLSANPYKDNEETSLAAAWTKGFMFAVEQELTLGGFG